MELAFEDEASRDICLKHRKAVAVLGPEVAHELVKRLADLRAADVVTDLPVGLRIVEMGDCEAICVALSSHFELTLVANHLTNPVTVSGKIDWGKVSRLRLINIERAITQ